MDTQRATGPETDDSYARLRQAIVQGDLLPNERLVELDLAQTYGVGRAAIRTALARLEQEGLVEREPNRGARVRAISETEAVEIFEARAVLEGLVARYAAQQATEADVAELRAISAQMQQRFENSDLLGMSDLNSQLHAKLQQIADNATVSRLLERLQAHHVRYQYRTILVPGRAPHSLQEHRAIVEAIAAHDSDAAEAAMRTHLSHVVEALRRSSSGARGRI
ncbi:MAG TPA: GntR family transcriptional regulator [Roseiflexaceae bacterium]|nr:GntR family transcriptional regulator [Roseiflexaceae bacterium]